MFGGTDYPDAVFVANDHMAFAVMDVMRNEYELSIPQDVAVIGYDDVPPASWPAYNLTTLRQPAHEMVASTITTLIAQNRRCRCHARTIFTAKPDDTSRHNEITKTQDKRA